VSSEVDGPTYETEGSGMYRLHGVTKTFRKGRSTITALHDVDLTVEDGAFVAIQGATGSGKSTLLMLLGGLDRPTSGTVEFAGKDLARMSEGELTRVRRQAFGFVFQAFNLIPTLTAQENVETSLVPLGIHGDDRRRRAMETLELVGLGDRARHLPGELSGGEQQRVGIARAIVRNPKVVLADEPTGNLDERTRDEIFDLLEGLWRNDGQTLIVVTHDSAVSARASKRVSLKEGSVRVAAPRAAR
jgi:putative ABC transport system ATP-binding protein